MFNCSLSLFVRVEVSNAYVYVLSIIVFFSIKIIICGKLKLCCLKESVLPYSRALGSYLQHEYLNINAVNTMWDIHVYRKQCLHGIVAM
jgi:hypothetical protein